MMVPSALPESKIRPVGIKEQAGHGLSVTCQRAQPSLAFDIPKHNRLIFGSRGNNRSIRAKCDSTVIFFAWPVRGRLTTRWDRIS